MIAMEDSRPGVAADSERWRVLSLLCLAVVLSLTTWFSATAILPELKQDLALTAGAEAWLTNGVQVGFVIGALAASLVNLPDLMRLSRLMAAAALVAALANASLLFHPDAGGAIAARIVTGTALAGVYPPALKLVATWFTRDRGLALGAVIGALTIGSALLVCWLLGLGVARTGFETVDGWLAMIPFATVIFAALAIGGLPHAFNILDG